MPKRIQVASHLSVDELGRRYRRPSDPVERSHYQILWLIAPGQSVAEVAKVTGYSRPWLRTVVRRYNQAGAATLMDRRHQHPGGRWLLTPAQQAALAQALQGPAAGWRLEDGSQGGRVDGPAGQAAGGPPTRPGLLAALGLSLATTASPSCESPARSPSGFQKTLADLVTTLKRDHPDATVELWAEDEHRVGLKPIVRCVWAKRGQRPLVPVHHRFHWLYGYGFVQPEMGCTFLPIRPKVNVDQFNQALTDFAQFAGISSTKQCVVVLDQAGWHRSKKVTLPLGLQLVPLPPYSPELQPAERLWPLTNEGVANQCFADLGALANVQRHRCEVLQQSPQALRNLTLFHWWPTQNNDHQ